MFALLFCLNKSILSAKWQYEAMLVHLLQNNNNIESVWQDFVNQTNQNLKNPHYQINLKSFKSKNFYSHCGLVVQLTESHIL